MSENLTASELEQLRALLQRFAEYDLDQFENLRFDTRYVAAVIQDTALLIAIWQSSGSLPTAAADASRTPASASRKP